MDAGHGDHGHAEADGQFWATVRRRTSRRCQCRSTIGLRSARAVAPVMHQCGFVPLPAGSSDCRRWLHTDSDPTTQVLPATHHPINPTQAARGRHLVMSDEPSGSESSMMHDARALSLATSPRPPTTLVPQGLDDAIATLLAASGADGPAHEPIVVALHVLLHQLCTSVASSRCLPAVATLQHAASPAVRRHCPHGASCARSLYCLIGY
jgi:hypothetical protein